MQIQKHPYTKLFWELLKTDLRIYKDAILSHMVDSVIWFTCLIAVFGYVFPMIGMHQGFSAFIAVGAIVSCSYWDTWGTSTNFISDLQGNKTINYYLTLPLPNWLVLAKQALGYAIKAGIPSLIILPLGKLFLWKQMSLANFSSLKFILIFILTNIFVGSFSLFITSTIKNLHHMNKVGIRFLFPLWFFGGANYPWETLYKLSPIFGYLCLLNPLLYAMEGMHVAVLGQEGYLPYWICVLMLLVFTILFEWLGIVRLKKRLDFV